MPTSALTPEDLRDIQGLVLNGYGHLKCSNYVFLRVTDQSAATTWLAKLIPQVRTCARRARGEPKPDDSLNLAFTFSGLRSLGLPNSTLDEFPTEFAEGMAGGERPRVLGDTDDSAPETWEFGGPNTEPIDLLVMIFGVDGNAVARRYTEISANFDAGGVQEVYRQDTGRISNYEPFGFHDGISQPTIAGAPGKALADESPIKAGEFVLGYLNGYNTPGSPVRVEATDDAQHLLPEAECAPGKKDFGHNGTYVVFRKLEQDVKGFWSFLQGEAERRGKGGDSTYTEWLGAKLVGRWKCGVPLVLSPDSPGVHNAQLDVMNAFEYMDADANGLRCPVGAHIRRANPRDSMPPNPRRSKVVADRHRLIRRGRHYEDHNVAETTVGLCFVALNADLQRQFEFVQQTWLNSPKFNGLFDEKDPLAGNNDGTTTFAIPMSPARLRLNGIPRFVRTRGGGYFFMPGMNALRFLAGKGE